MQAPTDRQLITDMQRGDRVAMEHFFRRYSAYLYAVCLRYVSDRELAKDLLHDAFVRIFTSIGTFKTEQGLPDAEIRRSIKSWSARLTANLALNHLRDTAHMQKVEVAPELEAEIPDSEIDAESLSVEAIMKIIEGLPPNYRTVFNLYAVEGYTHREIAGMLGISESLSATQYHRAKTLLKTRIKQYISNR